ncbi:MAG: hypothetical protein QM756_41415 [Polyangiaceae bacterium]
MKKPTVSRLLAYVFGFGMLSSASPAFASPEYPSALRSMAGMSCAPQCTVCHTVNPGRSGTAVQPFALALRKLGLLPGTVTTLNESFGKLKADTSAEAMAMVQALDNDFDPNYDMSLGQLACGPSYGCGAHVAKAPPRSLDGLAWALGAVALFVSARRLKSKRG